MERFGLRHSSVSCTCTRVATLDGHMLSIFVETEKECTPDDYKKVIRDYNAACRKTFGELPSAPQETIIIKDEDNRPQPRLDRELGDGMSTVVGRIRQDEVFGNCGLKYVALSHNTKRGAAKGELLARRIFNDTRILLRRGFRDGKAEGIRCGSFCRHVKGQLESTIECFS